MNDFSRQAGESGAHSQMRKKSVLELRDVSIYYNEVRAVKNISFNIRRNRITAIIGPSGCGKSTLLRSLNRMNDFVEGSRPELTWLLSSWRVHDFGPDDDAGAFTISLKALPKKNVEMPSSSLTRAPFFLH